MKHWVNLVGKLALNFKYNYVIGHDHGVLKNEGTPLYLSRFGIFTGCNPCGN